MSEIFTNVLTIKGQQKKAIAEAGGAPVNITHFKIGDGNGAYYDPVDTQTDLVHTVYSGEFVEGTPSQIIVNPLEETEVLYKCFIPANIGDFTVRELGLFDAANDLLLICKIPAQEKFAVSAGVYQPLTLTPKMIYTNPQTQAVLTVSSQVIATQEFVSQEMSGHINDTILHGNKNIIGSFVHGSFTNDHTPDGCLPTNGSEYTFALFQGLVDNYLLSDPAKLQTCTYAEYASAIAEYGFCEKFAVDEIAQTFKVPTRNNFRKLVKKWASSGIKIELFDDGYIIMKGFAIGGATATTKSVTFPDGITLLNTDYQLSNTQYSNISFGSTQDGKFASGSYTAKTTTGFTFRADIYPTVSLGYDWEVRGYTTPPDLTSIREFVVIANGEENESSINWSEWLGGLALKANPDLSNIDATAKKLISRLGKPSNTAQTLTIGASGSYWTAPKNGVIFCSVNTASATIRLRCNNSTDTVLKDYSSSVGTANYGPGCAIRCSEGDKIYYDYTSTLAFAQIIYDEGEI